jgi:hypothetical protein
MAELNPFLAIFGHDFAQVKSLSFVARSDQSATDSRLICPGGNIPEFQIRPWFGSLEIAKRDKSPAILQNYLLDYICFFIQGFGMAQKKEKPSPNPDPDPPPTKPL